MTDAATLLRFKHVNNPTACGLETWRHEETTLSQKFDAIRDIVLPEFEPLAVQILTSFNKRKHTEFKSLQDVNPEDVIIDDVMCFAKKYPTLIQCFNAQQAKINLLNIVLQSLSLLRGEEIMYTVANGLFLANRPDRMVQSLTKEQTTWATQHIPTEEEMARLNFSKPGLDLYRDAVNKKVLVEERRKDKKKYK